jgi:hypothetical protein
MMMTILGILALSAQEPPVPIITIPPAPSPYCRSWQAARSEADSQEALRLESWLFGFLGGMNWALRNSRSDPLFEVENSAILSWIDRYCRDNPSKDILQAALAFDDEMVRQRRR